MRELKFRAFDRKTGDMFNIHEMQWCKNKDVLISFRGFYDWEKDGWTVGGGSPDKMTGLKDKPNDLMKRYEIMQYTGLNDKNGKPIYEGDVIYWQIDNGVGIESYTAIVRWSENLEKEGWNNNYKWLVAYLNDYYRGSYDELTTPAVYNDELIILGNEFENPELLGGNK